MSITNSMEKGCCCIFTFFCIEHVENIDKNLAAYDENSISKSPIPRLSNDVPKQAHSGYFAKLFGLLGYLGKSSRVVPEIDISTIA